MRLVFHIRRVDSVVHKGSTAMLSVALVMGLAVLLILMLAVVLCMYVCVLHPVFFLLDAQRDY